MFEQICFFSLKPSEKVTFVENLKGTGYYMKMNNSFLSFLKIYLHLQTKTVAQNKDSWPGFLVATPEIQVKLPPQAMCSVPFCRSTTQHFPHLAWTVGVTVFQLTTGGLFRQCILQLLCCWFTGTGENQSTLKLGGKMKLFNLFVWDGLFYVLSTLQHVSFHRMQGLLVLVFCFFVCIPKWQSTCAWNNVTKKKVPLI